MGTETETLAPEEESPEARAFREAAEAEARQPFDWTTGLGELLTAFLTWFNGDTERAADLLRHASFRQHDETSEQVRRFGNMLTHAINNPDSQEGIIESITNGVDDEALAAATEGTPLDGYQGELAFIIGTIETLTGEDIDPATAINNIGQDQLLEYLSNDDLTEEQILGFSARLAGIWDCTRGINFRKFTQVLQEAGDEFRETAAEITTEPGALAPENLTPVYDYEAPGHAF